MTPEQKRELRDRCNDIDRYFQKETGADVPTQMLPAWFSGREAWLALHRIIRIVDEAYEQHQRLREAGTRVVEQLEGR
jgi:outer membrane biogenesis lipoprotein LolB